MGINRFVYLLFAVSVGALIWLGITYAGSNKAQLMYTDRVEHTYQVIIASQYCEKLLLDAEAKQRGFIITGDAHFKEAADLSVSQVDSTWRSLRDLTNDNPSQRVNVHLLQTAIQQRLALIETDAGPSLGKKERLVQLERGGVLMEKIHTYIGAIENEERLLLVERRMAKDHYQSLNFTFVKYGFFFACLLCIVAILLIVRELRKRVNAQLQLEKTVLDLKQSNEEVDQITFTASHDLQEPLRKIGTLSTLLYRKMGDKVDEEGKDILDRIERSTSRTQLLINDLVNFTVLLNTKETTQPVDLDVVFRNTFEKIKQQDPTVKVNRHGVLPYVRGYEAQLDILFTQLLDNSLKYKHPDRALVINVTYGITEGEGITSLIWKRERTKRYHQVTVSDNGIGFSNDFKEKIFVLFQRLHAQQDIPGKGMGLSLARRIMTNHYGFIEGSGEEGVGASFKMYFPVES